MQLADAPWKTVVLILAALVIVPILAYRNMKQRMAGSDTIKILLSEKIPDLYQVVSPSGGWVLIQYQNQLRLASDGHGLAVYTWDEHQKNPAPLTLNGIAPRESDFPVVAFFNRSGFDPTGEAMVLRRAADGRVVATRDAPKVVQTMQPLKDGTFRLVEADGMVEIVSQDVWYTQYMRMTHVAPTKPGAPTQGEARKTPPAARAASASALGAVVGRAMRIESLRDQAQPLPNVTVVFFKGKIDPIKDVRSVEALDPDDKRLAGVVRTNKLGAFSIDLPAGTYTPALVLEGKLYGNSANQEAWPAFELKAGQRLGYEFRDFSKIPQ